MGTGSSRPPPRSEAWRHLENAAEVPIEGDVTVPLAVWRRHRAALLARDGRTGVRVGAGEDGVELLARDARHLALIVVEAAAGRVAAAGLARALRRRLRRGTEIRVAHPARRDRVA